MPLPRSTVTLLHPLHLNDPTPGNDTATSANQVVPVFDVSDLKVSLVTVSGSPQPLVGTPFFLTATSTVHNNGPSGPAATDVTASLNLPPDCTTPDTNPKTAENIPLATSAATPVGIVWSVTCTSHSFHIFSADTTIVLDAGLHVRDPNSGNDSASSPGAAIPVFAQADGKIVSAVALNPPTEITANTNVNITIRKNLHNNGPFGATNFDLSKSIPPPPGCTVTPPPTTSHTLVVSTTLIVDEIWVINCQAGSHSLSFNNSLAPTELHVIDVAAGNNSNIVSLNVFVDTDGDSFPDDIEVACGSNPNDGGSIPERVDGIFAGVDDDGNDGADEALPGGAGSFDCDGDGYSGDAEDHVYSYNGQTNGDQKTCQEYDAGHANPNGDIEPSLRWPSDFNKAVFPLDSFNKTTLLDIISFLAPVKYLGTNLGANPDDVRWDLTPGPGVFPTDINIQDITALLAGSSGNPPMLGGAKAFNGPVCPWAP